MAHKTPAINSDKDIIKMDSVCKGTCYYTIPFNGSNNLRNFIENHSIDFIINQVGYSLKY